jgi:hypothetical protein
MRYYCFWYCGTALQHLCELRFQLADQFDRAEVVHGAGIGVVVGHGVLGLADLVIGDFAVAQPSQSIVESVFVTGHLGLQCNEDVERLLTGDRVFQSVEHSQNCFVEAADWRTLAVFVIFDDAAVLVDVHRAGVRHDFVAEGIVLHALETFETDEVALQSIAQCHLDILTSERRVVRHDVIHHVIVRDEALWSAVDGCNDGGRRFGVRHMKYYFVGKVQKRGIG